MHKDITLPRSFHASKQAENLTTAPHLLNKRPLTKRLLPKLIAAGCLALLPLAAAPQAAKPKLLVLISVDQLRPDRLDSSLPGGLGRLARQGLVYTQASLNHAMTSTCPGHVVISTGMNPSKAGIPGNTYIDRDSWEQTYCVNDSDPKNTVIGSGGEGRSPAAITATTLGDWLKQASPKSKVFAVSGKDRAAITMAGKSADAAYWFSREGSIFTTSGYYAKKLPGYLKAFNGKDFFVDGFGGSFPSEWTHGSGSYRTDDFVGESELRSRTSGHPLNQGKGKARADNIYYSPYVDDATMALATRLISAEKLGQRGVTDLLALSFSATDTVGHHYGPYSAESESTLNRLDASLDEFLELLDSTLGEGSYLVALTADHGVLPLPEWLAAQEALECPVPGGRLESTALALKAYWHTYWAFTKPLGNPQDLIKPMYRDIAVNRDKARELGLEVSEIVASLKAFFETRPGVAKAWTVDEVLRGKSDMAALYRNSYVPNKSGDLFVQLKATCLDWFFEAGTTHGSPHGYDRDVPLIFFGPGVTPGKSAKTVHTIDIAPTMADLLGLPVPDDLDGRRLSLTPDN